MTKVVTYDSDGHVATIEKDGKVIVKFDAAPQPEPVEVEPVALVVTAVPVEFEETERDIAYDAIDRHLRNTLDDTDYAEYSEYLETIYTAPPDYEEIKRQRDELLAALLKFIDSHEECTDFDGFTAQIVSMGDYHEAQEALASVKG